MNNVSPKKLLNSKWTATQPQNREKHFVVIGWTVRSSGVPDEVQMKALLTEQTHQIPWRNLKDQERWRMGWI